MIEFYKTLKLPVFYLYFDIDILTFKFEMFFELFTLYLFIGFVVFHKRYSDKNFPEKYFF